MKPFKIFIFLYSLLTFSVYANTSNLSDNIDIERYTADVEKLAVPRIPGSHNHQLVREFIIQRLSALGYTVQLDKYDTGVNIIGRKTGISLPNEEIIVSAHYDSTNRWCNIECNGADDNASGVAAALETARVLADKKFERTLTIAFWDEEETGYLGSKAYTNLNNSIETKMVFSYDVIGYTSYTENSQSLPRGLSLFFNKQVTQIKDNNSKGDFIALASDNSNTAKLASYFIMNEGNRINLPVVSFILKNWQKNNILFKDFGRSDHSSFWKHNIPAMGISDTANFRNPNYHCANDNQDSVNNLDYLFATKVTKVITYATAALLDI